MHDGLGGLWIPGAPAGEHVELTTDPGGGQHYAASGLITVPDPTKRLVINGEWTRVFAYASYAGGWQIIPAPLIGDLSVAWGTWAGAAYMSCFNSICIPDGVNAHTLVDETAGAAWAAFSAATEYWVIIRSDWDGPWHIACDLTWTD